MRITQGMLSSNLLYNLNKSSERQMRYQNQLTMKRRITRLSDDPVGVVKSMNARNEIAKLTQYQKNIDDAYDWLSQTETSLAELDEIIQRAYELALDAANDTKTHTDRQAIGFEVNQLIAQAQTTLNSTYSGQFIFGGHNTMTPPFEVIDGEMIFNNQFSITDDALSSLEEERDKVMTYEVGQEILFDVSMSGLEVTGIGEGNLFDLLNNFLGELMSEEGQSVNLTDYARKLSNFQKSVLSCVADIGGRMNRLSMMKARYDKDEINNQASKSRIEDDDTPSTITKFSAEEAVYRTALAVGARVIQPSLMDFLR